MYLALEDDPELEFEFFLATQLGMTLARMRDEMSAEEFMHWSVYYGRKAQQAELAGR